jgi:hypothetical protein
MANDFIDDRHPVYFIPSPRPRRGFSRDYRDTPSEGAFPFTSDRGRRQPEYRDARGRSYSPRRDREDRYSSGSHSPRRDREDRYSSGRYDERDLDWRQPFSTYRPVYPSPARPSSPPRPGHASKESRGIHFLIVLFTLFSLFTSKALLYISLFLYSPFACSLLLPLSNLNQAQTHL